MFLLCTTASILCLAYFILLLLYSGFTSAFYLIWPVMSVGFLGIGWFFRLHLWQRLPAPLRIGLLLTAAVCLIFFLAVEAMILKGAVQMPSVPQNYVIVLGAHVRTSGPSRALALRLDKALEYAEANPDTVIIVSGGQGSNEPCTESSAMKAYLLRHGLAEERILEEDRSTNTRENLLFSKKLIPDGSQVGIISNDFHICRALHLAEKLGYEQVSGIPAKSDLPTQPANLLREFFAVVKDFWIHP
ncbi:MAG: YdcF family protein [Clostridiales bacterium]|nr:YdcF family protein [Clostridiales bacterium]